MKIKFLFILMSSLFLLGCGKINLSSPAEYLKWVNNEDNGLVKIKHVNGMQLKIKYLPAEYLVYLEKGNEKITPKEKDSILDHYKNSLSFSLSIGPDSSAKLKQDVMFKGIENYEQYVQRAQTMNFDMEKFVLLKAGNKEYKPVLSAMENIYSLDTKRTIVFVFTPGVKDDKTLFESAELNFIYDDELFELGKNYFVFNRENLSNVPAFPFVSNYN